MIFKGPTKILANYIGKGVFVAIGLYLLVRLFQKLKPEDVLIKRVNVSYLIAACISLAVFIAFLPNVSSGISNLPPVVFVLSVGFWLIVAPAFILWWPVFAFTETMGALPTAIASMAYVGVWVLLAQCFKDFFLKKAQSRKIEPS